MSDRPPTEPPKTIGGWILDVAVLLLAVTCIAAVVGVLWALHMRELHAVVESADCPIVVFNVDGQHWTYAPEHEQCKSFEVGAHWLIEVNDLGTVKSKGRE